MAGIRPMGDVCVWSVEGGDTKDCRRDHMNGGIGKEKKCLKVLAQERQWQLKRRDGFKIDWKNRVNSFELKNVYIKYLGEVIINYNIELGKSR